MTPAIHLQAFDPATDPHGGRSDYNRYFLSPMEIERFAGGPGSSRGRPVLFPTSHDMRDPRALALLAVGLAGYSRPAAATGRDVSRTRKTF